MEPYKTQWVHGNMGTQQSKNIWPRGMGVATTCAAGFGKGI